MDEFEVDRVFCQLAGVGEYESVDEYEYIEYENIQNEVDRVFCQTSRLGRI